MMIEDIIPWLLDVSAWVLPVVIAITLHEVAHGWMAARFGDMTATRLGRVTLNPLKHIDRFGTIVLPGLLVALSSPFVFGYAKPVPVSFEQLAPRRVGAICVALAGPGMNVLLAVTAGFLLHIDALVTPEQAPWLFENLYRALMINCVLVAFNLLPVLPLDGGRVVATLLPRKLAARFIKTERYVVVLLLLCLMVGPSLDIPIADMLIGAPAKWLLESVLRITGNFA